MGIGRIYCIVSNTPMQSLQLSYMISSINVSINELITTQMQFSIHVDTLNRLKREMNNTQNLYLIDFLTCWMKLTLYRNIITNKKLIRYVVFINHIINNISAETCPKTNIYNVLTYSVTLALRCKSTDKFWLQFIFKCLKQGSVSVFTSLRPSDAYMRQ